ncbi:selenium metabolism-associated LysR family transcriptional regulator [Bacillus benzoevorans]|uniref:DNA-binding transcriptional LysR family regulator n=1 Tax=Bacillus benzoevorans TaxID=1456 RepID=A0A7X0HTG7_9BACI|nr:selenium metabolism-associated LysR family transcriptional regulator [Bacillus benzoevorans]MBB6445607.1 DNA-binding transcriptional LysR family regulator [Bacillus benzoevorans]
MDLHQLYIFTKVVEHKSFSKAAEDIYLSQSTVSSHIHSLEKSLGVALFDRVGRESILTPYGERLYKWAVRLLHLKDEALLDLNEGMSSMKGNIRIAASSVPSQFIIPKMVKAFRKEHKGVTFYVDQSSSKSVAERVLNGSVDLGILGEKYGNDKLRFIPLVKEKLALITPLALELTEPVYCKDVVKYPFIMRNSDSGTNAMVDRYLKKYGIAKEKLNVIAYADSSQSVVQFVMEEIGVAIMSEIAAKEHAKMNHIHMYPLEDFKMERYFYLTYHINRTQSLLTKEFIKQVSDLI